MKKSAKDVWVASGVSGGIWSALAAVLFFSLFVNLLVLAPSLYMLQVYDRVLISSQVETLVFLSLIALLSMVTWGLLDGVRGFMMARLGRFVDLRLRGRILTETLAYSRHDPCIQRRIVDDFNTMRSYLGSAAPLPFMDVPWVPLFLLIIGIIHPWLGMLAVSSAALLFGLALLNDLMARKYLRLANQQLVVSSEFAGAAIQSAEAVQALGMQDALARRYGTIVETMSLANQKAADAGAIMGGISKTVRVIVQSAALGLGAYLVIHGQMSAGGMIAASIILGRALAPIEQLIGSWRQFLSARDAYGKVRSFLKSRLEQSEPMPLPGLKGRLAVTDLSYQQAPGSRAILKRVEFPLEPGQAMALVGPSASGKSTLCRILVGAIASSSGTVRLDNADISQLGAADVRSYIGYLPQSVELFAGTVRENIARMGEPDDAQVLAAARQAGCHDMILQMPDGYETELGQRGAFISAGQRQRIGLARALYGAPLLLVLDEPNSNLDQDGEVALIAAVELSKASGACVIVVSHRLSLLKPIDRIGVLRDGVLERFGERDEVMRALSRQPAVKPALLQPATIAALASGERS